MAKSVPTKNSLMDSAKTGGINGGTLAAGELIGRAVLGAGPGTIAGGLAAAAMEEGTTRDTMSMIAVERGANELFGRGL